MGNDADSRLSQILDNIRESFDWHKLPKPLGLWKLSRIRSALREENLYDTGPSPEEKPESDPPPEKPEFRTFDGTYTDLECPHMGAEETTFGRNFPLDRVEPDSEELMDPNPRKISRQLLTRDSFTPAKIINLLAAAWVQFQVHDWFAHKQGNEEDGYEIPIDEEDSWSHGPMRIPPTQPASSDDHPPAYENRNTHWWDGSQIYGSDEETARKLRTGSGGKMKLGEEALLPLDVEGAQLTGFRDNWWIGLSLLHSVFVKEHNAICERLQEEHPEWDDERLFHQARLINAALLAKIHTVEWTPAILPHPTVSSALHINWDGVVSEGLKELFPFLDEHDVLGGITGSTKNHHGTPYSLTEEFVAVYRMHPLMPDRFQFHSVESGEPIGQHTLPEVIFDNAREIMEQYDLPDLFYSFGTSHPGALRLHNYPKHLQALQQRDGKFIDLGAVDILRDRERGVPRYNEFRKLLRMDPVSSFEDMTEDPELAAEIREVYDGDIDKVDLMIGMFAEPLLEGFGFSETAFRIFILMASRRLKSDRFYTEDFTEERYTKEGLNWIKETTMKKVLLRHHPELEPVLQGVDNAFQPWGTTEEGSSS